MIGNLKRLYALVGDKKAFIELVSSEYDRTPESIKSNWFSSWAIPEANRVRIHQLLINFIRAELQRNERILIANSIMIDDGKD